MTLARVRGTIVSTRRTDEISGARFLLVEECDQHGSGISEFLVALDMVSAAAGQLVLLAQGSSCRWTTMTEDKPIEALIMAIVDQIDERGKVVYEE
jgi:ethanolamine utilization protein EutN/carbon dioxide concentrating mechanism protein CcmL